MIKLLMMAIIDDLCCGVRDGDQVRRVRGGAMRGSAVVDLSLVKQETRWDIV